MALSDRNIQANHARKTPTRDHHIIECGEGALPTVGALHSCTKRHSLLRTPLPLTERLKGARELEALRAGEEADLAEVDTEEWNALLGYGGGGAEEGAIPTEREEHFTAWESRRDVFALLGCVSPVLDAARGAPACRLVPRFKGEVVLGVVYKSVAAHRRIIAYGHTRVAYRTRASWGGAPPRRHGSGARSPPHQSRSACVDRSHFRGQQMLPPGCQC